MNDFEKYLDQKLSSPSGVGDASSRLAYLMTHPDREFLMYNTKSEEIVSMWFCPSDNRIGVTSFVECGEDDWFEPAPKIPKKEDIDKYYPAACGSFEIKDAIHLLDYHIIVDDYYYGADGNDADDLKK